MVSHESTNRLAGTRVIVVEDSFPVAEGLRYLLGAAGCVVAGMAGNVGAALDLVAAAQFDLALLDIDLRGEIVTPVAEAALLQAKPVILLSGYGDERVLPAHLRALARLEKPVDPDELLALIERTLATAG
jgi:DNA-binding response OmpR family regulator